MQRLLRGLAKLNCSVSGKTNTFVRSANLTRSFSLCVLSTVTEHTD